MTAKVTVTGTNPEGTKGTFNLEGSGIQSFTCSDHECTLDGQILVSDMSDCLPNAVTNVTLKYCPDPDTISVTVVDDAVPIPISTMLKKVVCPASILV